MLLDQTNGYTVVLDTTVVAGPLVSSALVLGHTYALMVRATDLSGTGRYSEPVFFTVVQTTLSLSAPPVLHAADVVVTVTMGPAGATPTGNVLLFIDDIGEGTGVLVDGVTVFTIPSLASGSHTVLATYAAQNGFLAGSGTTTAFVAA